MTVAQKTRFKVVCAAQGMSYAAFVMDAVERAEARHAANVALAASPLHEGVLDER